MYIRCHHEKEQVTRTQNNQEEKEDICPGRTGSTTYFTNYLIV